MSVHLLLRGSASLRTACQYATKHSQTFARQIPKRWTTTVPGNVTATQPVPRIVGWWLGGIAGMAFGAVVLGGITRLTESGLSMVDWKLFGRPPPMTAEEWQAEFEKYQESPEYKYKNTNISMGDFKFIWYMEYSHRMWGRTIGAFFYIPAAIFWAKGYFPRPLQIRVVVAGALLAGQGLLGWYMVMSGLDHKNFEGPSDVPRVSQYRLASHLSAAMILYSFLFWNSLAILSPARQFSAQHLSKLQIGNILKLRRLAMGAKTLLFLTAVSGAFVAGLDAGLTYNSFPLMAGKIIPDDLFAYMPFMSNFTENPTTVQFDHRVLGTATLTLISYLAFRSRGLPLPPKARKAVSTLFVLAWLQVGLGITTLLMYVPVSVASCHQAGALTTLSAALWLAHEVKPAKLLKLVPK